MGEGCLSYQLMIMANPSATPHFLAMLASIACPLKTHAAQSRSVIYQEEIMDSPLSLRVVAAVDRIFTHASVAAPAL